VTALLLLLLLLLLPAVLYLMQPLVLKAQQVPAFCQLD
jgi:hypothetical protein